MGGETWARDNKLKRKAEEGTRFGEALGREKPGSGKLRYWAAREEASMRVGRARWESNQAAG